MKIAELPFTLDALAAAYADGVSAEAVIEEAYRRIAAVDDDGIFLHLVDPDVACAEARALGDRPADAGPLWGAPFVVKDNIDLAGAPTTAACAAYAYTPEADAVVVARLRAAGAILIGKTNLDQFATGLVGTRTPYPVPRNAVDRTLIPGGSSSGSAVAVAHGLAAFALGTDTAGSGRVPAAFNNIVGLKPTLGAISNRGVVPACRTLDTVSLFALTVRDAQAVLRAAAAFDTADPYGRLAAIAPDAPRLPQPRIGVPAADSMETYGDARQAAAFARSCALLTGLGARTSELDFAPFQEVARLLYGGAWLAERYTVVAELLERQPEALHPVTRDILLKARELTAADAFRDAYRLAALKCRLADLWRAVDALAVPSTPTFYTRADLEADPFTPNARLGHYTNFVNLLDLCALTVPTPARDDGWPGSLTLIAPAGQDHALAALGTELQAAARQPLGATDWRASAPEVLPQPGRPGPEELPLAVVGAHMSGLPLNGELTGLGARFLYRARTCPDYRLYALPGGPPVRPGLVADASGDRIEVEVWALPLSRVGAFLAGVPQPLAIGTVTLDDGTAVKGFLCEQRVTTDAVDVTAFGGWRHAPTEITGLSA